MNNNLVNTSNTPSNIVEAPAMLQAYLSDMKASLTSVESFNTYKRTLNCFFKWLANNGVKLKDVNQNTIINYRESLNNLSPYTANNYLDAIKRFFKWAGDKGFNDVAKNVRRGKISKGFTKEILEVSQIKTIYKYLHEKVESTTGNKKQYLTSLRNLVLFDFILKTGLRTMSVAGIKLSDLESKKGRQIIKYIQKGKKDKAFTILEPSTISYINRYISERGDNSPDSYLFQSHSNKVSGKQLSTKTIRYEIRKIYDQVGFLDQLMNNDKKKNKLTAHSLRHNYLCFVAKEKGIHAAQIEAGHESIDSTNLYLKYIQDDQRFVDRLSLDELFKTSPPPSNSFS